MPYSIELRRPVQRALDRLPKRDFNAVVKALKSLADEPRQKGVEKLKNTGLWRIRQGDYRIVYNIVDIQKQVIVVRIGHRREIYRNL
ncbi:MAG: type II toxin-antitoxin system RelE/ParE family toxin [Dehalococcoidales bacterium]|nr:type II toxin-antitoxin system RelE/ParE family toxin [Dehalococcoidales bacterium]